MCNRELSVLICAVAVLLVPLVAVGDVLYEGQGWRISGPQWGLAVVADPLPSDQILAIEVFKVFDIPPDPLFGTISPLTLVFEQIAPDDETSNMILINDEVITNGTAMAWVGFGWTLMQFGYADFNEELTFPGDFGGDPNGDFDLDMFNEHEWQYSQPSPGNPATWSQTLYAYDGVVPDGGIFMPGIRSGQLVIDVDLLGFDGSDADAIFFLKEYSGIPEPTAMATIALGGLVLFCKRRRIAGVF